MDSKRVHGCHFNFMSRFFCKMVNVPEHDRWGINLIEFTEDRRIIQRSSNGDQEAQFETLQYWPVSHILKFRLKGVLLEEKMEIFEISADLAKTLMRQDNWQRLEIGLSTKSSKTFAWLKQKGIIP